MPAKRPFNCENSAVISLLIFLFAFFLYVNTIPNGYALDDNIYNTGNELVQQGFKGLTVIFTKSTWYGFNRRNDEHYRPLPLACFAIQHELWGYNPHLNHFVNVAFYSLSCCLLMLMLRRLLKSSSPAIPLCITLLFTAHPIHTEVVANIKSLDEILVFLFFVSSLLLLLYHIDQNRPFIFALSVFSYFLCLLSKDNALTFVAVFPLVLWTFRLLSRKKILLLTLPYCCAALAFLSVRYAILDWFTIKEPVSLLNNSLMAATSNSDRLATAFLILGKYLKLLVFPWPLCWNYAYNQIPLTTWADPKAVFSFIIYLSMFVYATIGTLIRKEKCAFAILFFLITFSIFSNLFITICATLGERFLFTPSLGYCILVVVVFSKTLRFIRFGAYFASVILMAILTFYTVCTVNRNADWKDSITIITRDIAKNPLSASAHNRLGRMYLEKAERENNPTENIDLLKSAIEEFYKSIMIYPPFPNSWFYIGDAYWKAQRPDCAISAYQKVVEYEPKNVKIINVIGTLFFTARQYDSAVFYFRKALSIDSNNTTAYKNLGAVEIVRKKFDSALMFYKKALSISPNNKDALNNIQYLSSLLADSSGTSKNRTAVKITNN